MTKRHRLPKSKRYPDYNPLAIKKKAPVEAVVERSWGVSTQEQELSTKTSRDIGARDLSKHENSHESLSRRQPSPFFRTWRWSNQCRPETPQFPCDYPRRSYNPVRLFRVSLFRCRLSDFPLFSLVISLSYLQGSIGCCCPRTTVQLPPAPVEARPSRANPSVKLDRHVLGFQ